MDGKKKRKTVYNNGKRVSSELAGEAKRAKDKALAKLRAQVKRIGRLRCNPLNFANSISPGPGGTTTMFAVLLKCKNTRKKAARIAASDFTFIDASGDQHELIANSGGSGMFTEHKGATPKSIQKFLRVSGRKEVVLDLPFELRGDISADKELRLDFKGESFQLVFQ